VRQLEDIRGVDCSITALAHAIRRDPLRVYRDMPRDMSIKLPGIGTAAYLPCEISAYLWRDGRSHATVVYDDYCDIRWHRWGMLSQAEVLEHFNASQPGMLGLTKLASEKRHWIGFDGVTVNNLYSYYQRGTAPVEMTWRSFVETSSLDETGYGLINGHHVRLDMAILIR